MTDTYQPFYVVGGTMRHDAPSYVERRADRELFEALSDGEFCYVLTARQMGKSSLMIRTAARLRDAGIGVAVLDLTAVGQHLTVEQWYGGLVVQIGQRLCLEDELIEFWISQPLLGPMQRWLKALRHVVLPRYPGQLVIFVDEIDSVRSLPFSTDEFFAGIRECYNQRGEDAAMERVAFCLLGVATPSHLIRDTRTTPFNIGHRVELHDFTQGEAMALVKGLQCSERAGAEILDRIFKWTGGHPYLTQRLCLAISQERKIPSNTQIDCICKRLFFSPSARERDDNLLFVRERMLHNEADLSSLLELYSRVIRGKLVRDDESNLLVSILRLSGITRTEEGRLKVRNQIYQTVFDNKWLKAHIPEAEVRRQRLAYRRGMVRTAAISALVLMVVSWLALVALKQRNLAQQQAYINRQLLYFAQVKLAQQELEKANIDRVEELLHANLPQPGEVDLRGFEWYLLSHLAHGEILSLPKDGEPIVNVAFLNDGYTLAIGQVLRAKKDGDDEYRIRLYDWKAGQDISSFNIPAGRNFDLVVFSPDKRYVAADGPGKEVFLWDLRSGQRYRVFKGHVKAITAVAFSPDGRYLASADLDGVIKVWDIVTSSEKLTLIAPEKRVWTLTFSPDGRLLASTHKTRSVRLWDITTGQQLQPFIVHDGVLVRAVFLPDGGKILAADGDGRLHFGDVKRRRMVLTLDGHSSEVSTITFLTNRNMMATASKDRTVKVWDLENGTELTTIRGHGSEVRALAWSVDGRWLVTGSLDGAVKIWDANKHELLLPTEPVGKYIALSFSADGDLIALGSAQHSLAKLWNLSTGQELVTLAVMGEPLLCAAFSQDKKLLATGSEDCLVRIWDVATGKLIHALKGHERFVFGVNFSPDGKLLISGGEDHALIIWDVETGQEMTRLRGEVDNYYRAVFSPDGKAIASACRDGSVKLWDVSTGRGIKTLVGHTDHVRAIAFSPDGQLLATGGKDNTLRLWNLSTGKELKQMVQADFVQRAIFSRDGRRLVTGGVDGSVKIWDVVTWQELMTLKGHTGQVTSVTFSEDFMSLATCSDDGTVRLWRTASAEDVKR